jgi:hypothetical protein
MNRRGVCYDVGRVMWGTNWRPDLRPDEVARELAIIQDDLHCNAVRICGEDLDRLAAAAHAAVDVGLEVWLSPELWDHTPEETLEYIACAAERMREVHERSPGHVVFSVGSELTLFMNGIVPGNTVFERLSHPQFWETARSGAHNAPLNDFLARATEQARRRFGGPVTYASVPLESVDWSRFDFVGVDLYREAHMRDQFPGLVRRYLGHGRPVVITESGCCTYRGAADAGGRGFEILDLGSGRGATPAQLKGDYLRDESEQAQELTELLTLFDQAGVDGTFVMTFISPLNPYSVEPRFDLDMASFSLVRSYGSRLGEFGIAFPGAPWERTRTGARYPGLPWDPKESFDAVAGFYASQPALTQH